MAPQYQPMDLPPMAPIDPVIGNQLPGQPQGYVYDPNSAMPSVPTNQIGGNGQNQNQASNVDDLEERLRRLGGGGGQ